MSPRLTADERREAVIAAAAVEFAVGGIAGTATQAIARRAGVSQPYLFQLFGTKKELFLATVRDCFAKITRTFEASAKAEKAAGRDPDEVLQAMGDAYLNLLKADRDLLRLQLHAYAACSDPEIQADVRAQFLDLWQTVARLSGVASSALYPWFANGMLINVIASIDDARTLEEFGAQVHGGSTTAH
jgi:AcrR family transcriptional regulator